MSEFQSAAKDLGAIIRVATLMASFRERAMNDYEPRTFGRYDVIRKLGEGGMASVFLAHPRDELSSHKLLVVKELKPEAARDPAIRAMFLNEGRLAARLNHRNVVQLFDVCAEDDRHFLVMEYLDGKPLHEIVERVPRSELPLRFVLHILSEALNGLHYAHELTDFDGTALGVVHRDVSPHNLFVTYDGVVKLVDFGIAKASDGVGNTESGVFKGKIQYAAPEQLSTGELDRRADVFAAGVILWEALAGQRLWKDMPQLAIFGKLAAGEIRQLKSVAPDVPEELQRICGRALAVEREDRYRTAREMRVELEAYIKANNLHVSSGELGELLSNYFSKERSEVRRLVDNYMRRGLTGRGSDGSIDVPVPDGTGSRKQARLATGAHLATSQTGLVAFADAGPTSGEAKRRSRMPLALGSIVVAVGLVVAVVALRKRPDTVPSASAAQVASAPPPPAVVAAPAPAPTPVAAATVELEVNVRPAGARIELDGRELPERSPARVVVPRDDREHQLRVSATGHVPLTKALRLTQNVALDGALEREAPAKGPSRPVARGSKPGSDTAAPRATARPLDETDPYAR